MTRLTDLHLDRVRGLNPEPIPFPTQFCNMIYLQRLSSRFNNFSGFKNICWSLESLLVILGPIPPDLTRLVVLKRINLFSEVLLDGLKEI